MKLKIYIGLQKPLVAVGKNQCHALAFAEKYRGWHTMKQDRATVKAIKGLARRGCVEISADQFSLTTN